MGFQPFQPTSLKGNKNHEGILITLPVKLSSTNLVSFLIGHKFSVKLGRRKRTQPRKLTPKHLGCAQVQIAKKDLLHLLLPFILGGLFLLLPLNSVANFEEAI